METLTCTLQHIGSVTTWVKYVYMAIPHSVAMALSANANDIKMNKKVKQISQRYKKILQDIQKKNVTKEDIFKGYFAQSHTAKMVWNNTKIYFINKAMKEELKLCTKVMSNRDHFK
eukprot:15360845-Ditylum_brightwellii.AAC.1